MHCEPFDFDWRFKLSEDADPALAFEDFDDADWKPVDLPHDWSIEGPFSPDNPAGGAGAWAPCGIGWYRKSFVVPVSAAGELARLEFDGAYRNAYVYLNGELLGQNSYGYSSFIVELGTRLRRGLKNVIAVRVENCDLPNCRWYSGSGLYRSVRLVYYDRLCFSPWGTSITTTSLKDSLALLHAEISVQDLREKPETFDLRLCLKAPDGEKLLETRKSFQAEREGRALCAFDFQLPAPRLWSVESPSLYHMEAVLMEGGRDTDRLCTAFGIRVASFSGKQGISLNGGTIKLKGVCLHHSYGALGAAVPKAVWRRQLEKLKELGCNAVRTSHNPPDPSFLDLCDELGFLVIDEIFDKWEAGFSQPEAWYMRQIDFTDIWQKALENSIRRDRNHPSVILWSVGNEMGQPGTEELQPWLKTLVAKARVLDPSRPVSAAFVSSSAPGVDEKARRIMESAREVDVLCVNYQEPLYQRYHELDPDKAILGSETFIHFRGCEENIHAFGLRNPWYDVLEHDYVAGQFLWPGVDYLGEAATWPKKGWDVGLFDTTGRLKPGGQFHRSVWSDRPMVALAVRDHGMGRGEAANSWAGYSLSDHWNWPEFHKPQCWPETGGMLIEVEVQTNCETVEVLVNDVSYGEKASKDFVNQAVLFLIPYKPGRIVAIGRRDGVEVCRDTRETADKAAALRLGADKGVIKADGCDVAQVCIEVVDAQGRRVPCGAFPITLSVQGEGRLLGMDNGLLDSEEDYTSGRRTSHLGFCLAYVGRSRCTGEMRICASAILEGIRTESRLRISAR